jgi:hypothetical protein
MLLSVVPMPALDFEMALCPGEQTDIRYHRGVGDGEECAMFARFSNHEAC